MAGRRKEDQLDDTITKIEAAVRGKLSRGNGGSFGEAQEESTAIVRSDVERIKAAQATDLPPKKNTVLVVFVSIFLLFVLAAVIALLIRYR